MAKTVAGKILGALASALITIFKENWLKFITSLWGKLPKDIKEETREIVEIVNKIKEHPGMTVLDAVVAITKTDKDDKAMAWLREKLAYITGFLRLTDVQVQDLNGSDLHSIATRLFMESAGVTHGQASITIENAYANKDKKI